VPGRAPTHRSGDDGERVEDRAGVHDPDLVELGRGGVEALLLGVDAEDEVPPLTGLAVEMPLRPLPLVTAPAVPDSSSSPALPAATTPAAVAAERARNDLLSKGFATEFPPVGPPGVRHRVAARTCLAVTIALAQCRWGAQLSVS